MLSLAVMSSLAQNIDVQIHFPDRKEPSSDGMKRACTLLIIHGVVLLLSGMFILTWGCLVRFGGVEAFQMDSTCINYGRTEPFETIKNGRRYGCWEEERLQINSALGLWYGAIVSTSMQGL